MMILPKTLTGSPRANRKATSGVTLLPLPRYASKENEVWTCRSPKYALRLVEGCETGVALVAQLAMMSVAAMA